MAVTTPVYATRDTVKRAIDVAVTARMDQQIDRDLQASARQIEKVTNRIFYPKVDTRYFDWPTNYSGSGGRPWQIWLDNNELISLTSVMSGTVSIPTSNINLEPVNYGPPYTRIEILLTSSSGFSGAPTWQRAVAVSGLFGYSNDEVSTGLSTGVLTSSQTTMTVSDASVLSPGALIRVDAERMQVADTAMTPTGVTFAGPDTASANDNTLDVGASSSTFAIGETILLDAERMLITDISGTKLVVKRAWDGTVLAAHSSAAISALRLFTVIRGYLGTTAATHAANAPIYQHTVPALVESANVGLTLYKLGIERGGVRPLPLIPMSAETKAAKRTSSPVDAMLDDLVAAYGRRARTRVI